MTATDKDNASEPKAAEDNAKVAPPAKDAGAQYRVAIDRYREAAKWAVGAFGGIGAVLVAALPLAQFGAGFESSPAVVIAGTGLALAGVALAIASTLAVLAPRTVFSFELEAADKNRLVAFFSGGASMQRLLSKHGDVLLPAGIGDMAGLSRAIERIDKIASRNSGKPHQAVGVANLRAQRAEYVAHLEELLWVARLEKMRAAFHWSSASIVVCYSPASTMLGPRPRPRLRPARSSQRPTRSQPKLQRCGQRHRAAQRRPRMSTWSFHLPRRT